MLRQHLSLDKPVIVVLRGLDIPKELPDKTTPVEKARFLRNHWEGNADYGVRGCSGESRVWMTHTQIGKMKPPAMPCITPCVNMKCHSFVLKATPSIVATHRTQPTPIIGLY